MRVYMKTTTTVERKKDGVTTGTIRYDRDSYFQIADEELARAWIKAGVAEDPDGNIRRVDLLTYDEAIAAGLVNPEATTPEQFAAEQRPVKHPEPPPPLDPWATGGLWVLRSGKSPIVDGYESVRIARTERTTVTVTTLDGGLIDELTVDRKDFTKRYQPKES